MTGFFLFVIIIINKHILVLKETKMFIIFSKEKIRTYIISLITVISLFIFVLANNSKTSSENNIQASANIFTNNTE